MKWLIFSITSIIVGVSAVGLLYLEQLYHKNDMESYVIPTVWAQRYVTKVEISCGMKSQYATNKSENIIMAKCITDGVNGLEKVTKMHKMIDHFTTYPYNYIHLKFHNVFVTDAKINARKFNGSGITLYTENKKSCGFVHLHYFSDDGEVEFDIDVEGFLYE